MAAKNVVVTGGASGIGNAVALQLQARGDRVFIFDCLDTTAEIAVKLQSKNFHYIHVDVSSSASVKNGFDQVYAIIDQPNSSELFSKNLDILVNNAGITRDGLAIRMSESDWDAVMAVNLKGTFLCSQQALKRMMRQEKSYIINIASVVGLHGNSGQANYAASKAGIIALTKTLAQEYAGRTILVNAIAPGFIKTPMTEKLPEAAQQFALSHIALKRFGLPDDVANLVDFLTSGKADYITGQVVCLDGGMF